MFLLLKKYIFQANNWIEVKGAGSKSNLYGGCIPYSVVVTESLSKCWKFNVHLDLKDYTRSYHLVHHLIQFKLALDLFYSRLMCGNRGYVTGRPAPYCTTPWTHC